MVTGKTDIAFVEFDNEISSGMARDRLQNFKVTQTHQIRVSFAKR